MRNTQHATLSSGGYRYVYEDGAGLRCTVEAKIRRGPERQWWTHDALPDREFSSGKEALAAIDACMPDDLIAEAEKYPRLHSVAPDTCGNACRLCPRSVETWDDRERVKHDTTRFTIATSWQDFRSASLCSAHRDEFTDKPRELIAALNAEVAARKARAQPLCAPTATKDTP